MFASSNHKAPLAAALGVVLLQACASPWARAPHIPAQSQLQCTGGDPSAESVPAQDLIEVNALSSSDRVVFLDVRRREEHTRGHIKSSRSLNVDYLSPDFPQRLAALDRDTTYLVYCQCGGRSTEAVKLMVASGFKRVLHYREGYSLYVSDNTEQREVPALPTPQGD